MTEGMEISFTTGRISLPGFHLLSRMDLQMTGFPRGLQVRGDSNFKLVPCLVFWVFFVIIFQQLTHNFCKFGIAVLIVSSFFTL